MRGERRSWRDVAHGFSRHCPGRTTTARPGTLRSTTRGPPARQDTGRMIAGLPYRPNTAASVRGNEILHLPNQVCYATLSSKSNLPYRATDEWGCAPVGPAISKQPRGKRVSPPDGQRVNHDTILPAPYEVCAIPGAESHQHVAPAGATKRRLSAVRIAAITPRPRGCHGSREEQGVCHEICRA